MNARFDADDLVERADELARSVRLSAGGLVREALARAGWSSHTAPEAESARQMFVTMTTAPRAIPDLDVVAEPGSQLIGTPQPGDLLLRRGEGGLAHAAVVARPEVWSLNQLAGAGLTPESWQPGGYVQVVEGGPFPHALADGFARRLTDAAGRLLADTVLVRPFSTAAFAVSEAAAGVGAAPEIDRTDPAYWFLSKEQIRGARGGRKGTDRKLAVWTSKNLVQPLIDGEEMMQALFDDIQKTKAGDFIHLTAWRMDLNQLLVPKNPKSTVKDVWVEAIKKRKVTSRTLLWHVTGDFITGHGRRNIDTQDALRKAKGEATTDARHPAFGSHHQKSAVVQRDGEAVGYCGGIDLAADRWDTRRHDNDRRHPKVEEFAAWHDVHTRVRGKAVLDIEQNFRDRWNDKKWPVKLTNKPPKPITAALPPVASAPGTHHVQILRTFACAAGQYPSFAPHGEFTCLDGYINAIQKAQQYIYIEDQYLVWDEMAKVLVKALDRIKRLIIVVPDTPSPNMIEFVWHQENFIKMLQKKHAAKVNVFHLMQPGGEQIYVHAKLMIIDDLYAVIGSTNFGRRSMTHDTELAVAVVDEDVVNGVGRYPRDLRLNLWGEHLNLKPTDPKLADPLKAIDEWLTQARSEKMRVRLHTPRLKPSENPRRWNAFIDPDGQCGSAWDVPDEPDDPDPSDDPTGGYLAAWEPENESDEHDERFESEEQFEAEAEFVETEDESDSEPITPPIVIEQSPVAACDPCYKDIVSPAKSAPATIGFEFDLSWGASAVNPPIRQGESGFSDVYNLEGQNVSTHRIKADGFRIEADGNRIEIATKPFEINSAGRKEMLDTMAKVLAVTKEMTQSCLSAPKSTATMVAPRVITPAWLQAAEPATACKPATIGIACLFPLGSNRKRVCKKQTAGVWAEIPCPNPLPSPFPADFKVEHPDYFSNSCAVKASPQATFVLPLARIDDLVTRIKASESKRLAGAAMSGPSGERLGDRSDAIYKAQKAVNASRTRHIKAKTLLSDGKTPVTAANYSPTLQGLLILMVSYLWTSELPADPDDWEVFAKAYLPLNVKNPFRLLFADLTADERQVFTDLYNTPRENLWKLQDPAATAASGSKSLFPARTHSHQQNCFFDPIPTWDDFVEKTVTNTPLVRTESCGPEKKGEGVGCEVLFAPLSRILPHIAGSRTVTIEMRRLGFNWVYSQGRKEEDKVTKAKILHPSWLAMTTMLFDLAAELNK